MPLTILDIPFRAYADAAGEHGVSNLHERGLITDPIIFVLTCDTTYSITVDLDAGEPKGLPLDPP